METMTKKEKVKKFVKDHRKTIAKVTVYTTLIVGGIAIIARAISKEEQEKLEAREKRDTWVQQENDWLDKKTAEGNDVYLLHDWTYLFVPKGTETEWVGDRTPKPEIKKIYK